jgi:hypothetical protein
VAGDTGADKTKAQYHGHMELIVLCSWLLGQVVCEPIACTDLGGDQSSKHASEVYLAALEREGVAVDRLTSLESDNTDHARMGLEGVLASLPKEACLAIVEGCYRHLTVLEENGAMEAAFPDEEVVNYTRMLHEVVHASPEYYEEQWAAAGLPANCFKILMQIPEPTTAKWEVMAQVAQRFLLLLAPAPGKEGSGVTMLEEFCARSEIRTASQL